MPANIPVSAAHEQAAKAALKSGKQLSPDDCAWTTPDMSVVNEGRVPPPKLPLDLFHEEISTTVTAIAASKSAPPDYILGSVLSASASLVGNARWFQPQSGWEEPCAIWTCLVGRPSAGKTPAQRPIQHLLKDIERTRMGDFHKKLRQFAADVEKAKLITETWRDDCKQAHNSNTPVPPLPDDAVEPVAPARPRTLVQDVTVEELAAIVQSNPRGLLVFRDELSGLLGNFGRYGSDGDRAMYIEAYNGELYVVDRRKNDTPIQIDHLTLSISGGIQPDKLNTLLLSGDNDGFSARFLYFWPDPVRPEKVEHDYDISMLTHAFGRLEELQMEEADGRFRPVIMKLAEPELLLSYRQRLFDYEENSIGVLGSFIGKLPGICVRLAGLIELLNWAISEKAVPPQMVSRLSLETSIQFLNTYMIPMSKRVFNDAVIPVEDRNAALVAKHILKNRISRFNARQARKDWRLPGLREAKDMDAALGVLVESGWVRNVGTRDGGTKGQRKKDYVINPAVFA